MPRIKQGNIYEVCTDDGKKHYFQYVTTDSECLQGDVIRVFDYVINSNDQMQLEELKKSPTKFFFQTYISLGEKWKLWKKVAHLPLPDDFEMPYFRESADLYIETKKSYKWYIGKPNEKRIFVGELNEEQKSFPYDGVNDPDAAVKMIKAGYDYEKYPE